MKQLSSLLVKNEATIARNIKLLKEKGILERIGSDKTGHWEIIDKDK